jgi:hypothetical protein
MNIRFALRRANYSPSERQWGAAIEWSWHFRGFVVCCGKFSLQIGRFFQGTSYKGPYMRQGDTTTNEDLGAYESGQS